MFICVLSVSLGGSVQHTSRGTAKFSARRLKRPITECIFAHFLNQERLLDLSVLASSVHHDHQTLLCDYRHHTVLHQHRSSNPQIQAYYVHNCTAASWPNHRCTRMLFWICDSIMRIRRVVDKTDRLQTLQTSTWCMRGGSKSQAKKSLCMPDMCIQYCWLSHWTVLTWQIMRR